MTTTLSVMRTAVDPSASGGIVTLDLRTSPTDIFLTTGASLSIVLLIPSGPEFVATDFDGSRFRVTKTTTGGTVAISYSGAATTLVATAKQWAEFVLTCPDPASTAVWRLSALGNL